MDEGAIYGVNWPFKIQREYPHPPLLKQVEPEPESDLPFAEKERERATENPETREQIFHLERYGYFYK